MDQAILLKATEKQKEKSRRNVINWIQNKDGSITVPEVLRPYLGGLEIIR